MNFTKLLCSVTNASKCFIVTSSFYNAIQSKYLILLYLVTSITYNTKYDWQDLWTDYFKTHMNICWPKLIFEILRWCALFKWYATGFYHMGDKACMLRSLLAILYSGAISDHSVPFKKFTTSTMGHKWLPRMCTPYIIVEFSTT